jgi:hypothetical protein
MAAMARARPPKGTMLAAPALASAGADDEAAAGAEAAGLEGEPLVAPAGVEAAGLEGEPLAAPEGEAGLAAGTLGLSAGGETGVGMGAAGMEGLTTAVLSVKNLDGKVILSNLPAGGETAGTDAAGGAVAVAGGAWI